LTIARNTFAERSDEYAKARPQYPPALFEWIAAHCARRDEAWDCATGNGQAAVGLAPYFGTVQATDISREQIAHGLSRPNVIYSVRSAEDTGFPSHVFDVVTVAQALHWFDYDKFWPEVSRVARDGALFCAWGYDWPYTMPELQKHLVEPFRSIVAPFWAPNNRLLWEGYRPEAIGFPYERLEMPAFAIEMRWTLLQLIDYMTTWSAYKNSRTDAGAVKAMDDLMVRVHTMLTADTQIPIHMPLKTIAGRMHDD